MTRLERAKQFMPFAALHGFEEIIREKETVPIVKRELTVDEAKALDEIVLKLKKGDLVQTEYYFRDRYLKADGVITAIDLVLKKIRIVKTEIPFENLRVIKII